MKEGHSGGGSLAIVIPCLNEEKTIGKVVEDARGAFPEASIHVFDNGSTDGSVERARSAGADVVSVRRRGKGYVVRAVTERVTADVYLIVDGDDTYDLSGAGRLVSLVAEGACDMAVGARLGDFHPGAFRAFHRFGNRLVVGLINRLFGSRLTDTMSGFRAFTGEVAKKVPLVSRGFEVETEWTIQLLNQGYYIVELDLPYRSRTEGSSSKLNTFRDGVRVLWTIFKLFKDIKPLTFFGSISLLFYLPAAVAGAVLLRAAETPFDISPVSVIVVTGLFLAGLYFTGLGIVLNSAAEKHNQILSLIKKN